MNLSPALTSLLKSQRKLTANKLFRRTPSTKGVEVLAQTVLELTFLNDFNYHSRQEPTTIPYCLGPPNVSGSKRKKKPNYNNNNNISQLLQIPYVNLI